MVTTSLNIYLLSDCMVDMLDSQARVLGSVLRTAITFMNVIVARVSNEGLFVFF